MKTMVEYDNISVIIKFNYIVVITFITIVTVSNYTDINIITCGIFETLLLTLLSFIVYVLSQKNKNKIIYLINDLEGEKCN